MKLKYRSFVGGFSNQVSVILTSLPIALQIPESEKIKHTLIGSSQAVTATIQVLHQLGYADICDWSPLLPTHNPGEFISVLIRAMT